MNSTMKGIISGILSGIVFIIFYLVIHVSLLISIAISIIAYIGLMLIWSSPTLYGVETKDMDDSLVEQLKKTIDEGYYKVIKIRKLSKQIEKVSVKSKIDEICTISDKIFEYLRKNPKSVSNIRRFLNYYLDAIINILTKYVEIFAQEVNSREIEASLVKVETLLDTVEKTFITQQEKLIANDMDALDTEISLLEDIMKSEGIGNEK